MSQPTYSSAAGYVSEQFFTLFFDIDLDAANPPPTSAFNVQINGTGVSVSAVEVNSTDKSVKITYVANALTPGDIIEFSYQDPTGGNDVNAVQGLDGTDAATFSASTIVLGARPGPSAPPVPTLNSGSDSGTLGDHITSDNTPTLSGTSEANATVKLYDTDGTTLLGTTTADGSGNWSVTSSSLGDGSHTLKVTQTNSMSQTSPLSTGLTLAIDTVANAPTTLAMAAGSDSGTLGDGITNVGTPVITGVSEANATVRLYDTDGSTLLGTATANGSGKWSITSSNLVSGAHTLSAKQTDAAGNVSVASSGFSYTLDTIGPVGMALSTNSVPVSSATNGSTVATLSSTDITSVSYGFAVGNGTIDADNGKFSITGTSLTAAQNLSAGAYHIYLKATDAAGNDAFQIFVVNVTNAPSVSSIVRAGAASSTVPGSDTSVNYTVTFSQSVTGVDISDFTLSPGGTASGAITSISGSGSTYTVTVDTLGGDGTLRLDLNSSGTGIKNGSNVDITSGYTAGETYSLDHTAPTAPSTPAMTAGTDTGASSSDAITKNATPVFTGTGEANATVNLYDTDGTTLLGTATADGSGKWSVTSSTLSSGAHTVSVKQTDAAGNVSKASSTLAVQIDTAAPSAPGAPVLSPGSDSGVSGDSLTNVVTPVITGTAEANATVKLYDTDGTTLLGTTTADGSGKWSVTSSTLTSGSHTLSVKQTDVAGNVSPAGSGLNLNIDTSVPGAPGTPALQTASDSGTLSDGITKITTPTLTGTGTVGDTVTLYDTNGSTVLGTAVVDGSGNWSIASSALSDAVHTVTVKQTNPAGTASSASSPFNLTIDSSAPGAPSAPAMTAGTDTGASSSDAVTSNVTPVFTGTGEANATVKLFDTDGTTLLGTATADGSGKWSVTSSTLASGAHTLSVKQTDAAGNVSSASATLAVSIDTSTPAAPATPVLAPNSDNGNIGDSLTNVVTPAITGTAEANASVKLYDTDGTTLLGTAQADGSGKWSITSSTLSEGTHTLTVKQTDLAGNVSKASTSLALTIDTTIPGAPGTPVLANASDSGVKGDGVTGITTPVITGSAEANATVYLYDSDGTTLLGTALANGSGAWSITSSALSDGVHTLNVKQHDAAGNVSATSSTLVLRIDSGAPAAAAAPQLAAASDSGVAGDGMTKFATPTITGTAEAYASVTLYDSDGSTVLGSGQADGNGIWNIVSSSLADGKHTLSVKQADVAGNVSAASSTLALTIDTHAPTGLSLSSSSVSGSGGKNATVGSLLTTDATTGGSFTYALVAGSGDTDNHLFSISDGVLHIGDTGVTGSGTRSVRVSTTDAAGNSFEQILSITVRPVTTIDGVPVDIAPSTLPGGGSGTTVSVPVVTSARVDDTGNAVLADIPLSGNVLTAHVPIGYGLNASGGASQPAGNSLDHLIAAILATTGDHDPADRSHLTGNGQDFLNLLPTTVPLLVETVVPIAGSGAPGTALTLTGTSSSSQQTALVINTGQLPSGSTLTLQNVDFAAIVGAANINANTAGQTLTGDAASQHFTVSATNSSQVFSGGGDDVLQVGSLATPLQAPSQLPIQSTVTLTAPVLLHGGSGNDSAQFLQPASAYKVDQHDGYVLVSNVASPTQISKLVNIESIQFGDGTLTVQNRAELNTVAGLYTSILGRQPELSGFEYWSGLQGNSHVSLGAIAVSMINTAESRAGGHVFNGQSAHDVGVLYQAIFNRAADAGGLAYWTGLMDNGSLTLVGVADGFINAAEMNGHKLAPNAWNFGL